MTRGFWKDSERYLDTYWSRFPNVWFHGDLALIDEDGFWFLLGRSDDILKIAGKRVGPAEFETACMKHPAVAEAAVIGVPHDVKGQAVIVYVVLKPNEIADQKQRNGILQHLTSLMGKAFAPEEVRFTTMLPKTRSGKIVRRAIRALYLMEGALGDVSTLENVDALEAIKKAY